MNHLFTCSKDILRKIETDIFLSFANDGNIKLQKLCIFLMKTLLPLLYDTQTEFENLVQRILDQINRNENRFLAAIIASVIISFTTISIDSPPWLQNLSSLIN
jgi:hypothetical protein